MDSSKTFLCGGRPPLIPTSAICDGYPDCPNGDDEMNCRKSYSDGRKGIDTYLTIGAKNNLSPREPDAWNSRQGQGKFNYHKVQLK